MTRGKFYGLLFSVQLGQCLVPGTLAHGQDPSKGIVPFGSKIPIAAIAGLYAGPEKEADEGGKVRNYIRLCPDGTALSINWNGAPEGIAKKIQKGGPSPLLTGTYRLKDGMLEFTTADNVISVHFEGEVRGDTLILNWKSSYMERTGKQEIYKLIPGL